MATELTASKLPLKTPGEGEEYVGALEPGVWRFAIYVNDTAAIGPPELSKILVSELSAYIDFQITELAPVAITQQPVAVAAAVGTQATLSVVASGDLLSYQWLKDGTSVAGATGLSLVLNNVQVAQAGSYSVRVTNALGSVTSAAAVLRVASTGVAITAQPATQTVLAGGTATMSVTATGDALAYQWTKDGVAVAGATGASLTITNVQPAQTGRYAVTVSNALGTSISAVAELRIATVRPAITGQPAGIARFAGETATLSIGASGDFLVYQWSKDGVPIVGATNAALELGAFQPAMAGRYSVTVGNPLGTLTSETVLVEVGARLLSLSSRVGVETGGNLLICGLSLRGTANRRVLIRAAGPRLAEFGVSGALADPVMIVYDGDGKQIATNDDWSSGSEGATAELAAAFQSVGAFPFKAGDKDAALLMTLRPGGYSIHVRGAGDTTGVALMEVYDTEGVSSENTLVNLSTRAMVGTGGAILIQGITVQGGPKRLLVRAVGPRLGDLGVPGFLPDPVVKILNAAQQVVAENNNWSAGSAAATQALVAASTANGAFPLVAGSADAALIVTLPEGGYSIQVSGAAEGTGVALVEVYSL